jgi:hypothetical protein
MQDYARAALAARQVPAEAPKAPEPVATLTITRGLFGQLNEAKLSLLTELPAGPHALFTSTQLKSYAARQAPDSRDAALTTGSIADDPEFMRLTSNLWVSGHSAMLETFNNLARYIDAKLKGTK